jgi:Ca2+-transporting ATPase
MYDFDLQGFKQWMRIEHDTDSIPGWFPINQLTFQGLISLENEVTPSSEELIARCRDSQIKVMMATGDQAVTAMAIAKKVGIVRDESKEYSRILE